MYFYDCFFAEYVLRVAWKHYDRRYQALGLKLTALFAYFVFKQINFIHLLLCCFFEETHTVMGQIATILSLIS